MNFPQINTKQDGTQVVSARDLHTCLASKKQFADWIKHRITKYGLIEIPTNYILGKILGEIRFGIGLGLPPSDKGGHNV